MFSTDFTSADLPHAADDIENNRTVLDTRRLGEVLADGEPPRIWFRIFETTVYERHLTVDELDEAAPGWRDALARPGDHTIPGRTDLQYAVLEELDDDEEIEAFGTLRIQPLPGDHTPTHVTILRTFTDRTTHTTTVTVTADDIDAAGSAFWRSYIGAPEESVRSNTWAMRPIAELAEAQLVDAGDNRRAEIVEVLALTQ